MMTIWVFFLLFVFQIYGQNCNVSTHVFEITSTYSNQVDQLFYAFMIYPNCDKELNNLSISFNFENFTSLGDVYDNNNNDNNNRYLTWYTNCNLDSSSNNNNSQNNNCTLNYTNNAAILLVFSYNNLNSSEAPSVESVTDDMALHYFTISITNYNGVTEEEHNPIGYTFDKDIYIDPFFYSSIVAITYEVYVPEFNQRMIPDNFYTSYFTCYKHETCAQPCSHSRCLYGFCTNNVSHHVYVSDNVICREANGLCDLPEYCTGNTSSCPNDNVKNAFQICRESSGDCDPEEVCDGISKICPSDVFEEAGVVCRQATGVCEIDGICDGNSPFCPTDVMYHDLFTKLEPCRDSTGICDSPEYCNGMTSDCPPDDFYTSVTLCRSKTGDCDLEERCNGSSSNCPLDLVAPSTTICRSANGECDLSEYCTGTTKNCVVDSYKPEGTICRAALRSTIDNSTCDLEETCTGTGPQCPDDEFLPQGTMCRNKMSNTCDIEEKCTGTTATCPPDLHRGFIYAYQCLNNLYLCGVDNIVVDLNIPFVVSNRNSFHIANLSFVDIQYVHYLVWPNCAVECYSQNFAPTCFHTINTIKIIELACLEGDTTYIPLNHDSHSNFYFSNLMKTEAHKDGDVDNGNDDDNDEDANNNDNNNNNNKNHNSNNRELNNHESSYTLGQTTQLNHLKEAILRRKHLSSPKSTSTTTVESMVNNNNNNNNNEMISKDHNKFLTVEIKPQHPSHQIDHTLNNRHRHQHHHHHKRHVDGITMSSSSVAWEFIAIRTLQVFPNNNMNNNNITTCPTWIEKNWINISDYTKINATNPNNAAQIKTNNSEKKTFLFSLFLYVLIVATFNIYDN